MRRTFPAALSLLFLLISAAPTLWAEEDPGSISHWTLRVFLGPNYQNLSDLNAGAIGLTGIVMLQEGLYGHQQLFRPAHWGFEIGADLVYELTSNVGIGVGTGFFLTGRSTTLDGFRIYPPYDTLVSYSIRPRSGVIPLRAAVYISFPFGPSTRIVVNAGPELEFASIGLDVESRFLDWAWEQHEKASGIALGIQAGVGFEKRFSSWATLFVEVRGRAANLRELSGSHRLSNTRGFDEAADGPLYYWADSTYGVFHGNPHIPFPLIGVQAVPPSGTYISDVRRATVDLSGASVLAGLIFRF